MDQLFKEYIKPGKLLYDPQSDQETHSICRQYDAIVSSAEELRSKTFEDIVLDKFKPYIGKTIYEIREKIMKVKDFESWKSKPRDLAEYARTSYAMLGIKTAHAEEFEKSNIYVKTLRVGANGTIQENISFPGFEFSDLMQETWEESSVYEEMVDRKFLWVVYKSNGNDYVFYGAKFWTLPKEDEPIIKQGWDDIRDIVRNGVNFVRDRNAEGEYILTSRSKNRMLNSFPDTRNTDPSRKEHKLCPSPKPYNTIISIRPHSSKAYYDLKSINYRDTENPRSYGSELPNGDIMTKQCFWFNKPYILNQIQDLFE